jgi:hypothetical protein
MSSADRLKEVPVPTRFAIILALGMIGLPLGAASACEGSAAATSPVQQSPIQQAQMPPPFGDPGPQLPTREQCTPERRKRTLAQIQAFEKLQSLSRNEADQVCSMIENAEDLGKLADGRLIEQLLPPEARDFAKALGMDFKKMDMRAVLKMIGIDVDSIDLRQVKAQCRLTQGEADRMFTSELGRLKRELLMCEDTI